MKAVLALQRPVRMGVLGRYLGQLCLAMCALAVPPLAVSLWFSDFAISIRYVSVILILLLLGLVSRRLPEPPLVQTNEALVVVSLAFVLSALLMSFPMQCVDRHWLDVLFESVSAVTTTGLTTITHLNELPRTFLFARSWMQWYGGLGIAVLSVALLMGHDVAARRLAEPVSGETLLTTSRIHARRILLVYVGLTCSFIALLWLLSQDGFFALTHVLAGVSTGGFSPNDQSLAGANSWPVRYAVIGAALCGAIPLPLYCRVRQSGWKTAARDVELRALLVGTVLVALLVSGFLYWQQQLGWRDALLHGGLIGISAQSTAGFTTLPIAELDPGAKWVLILSMLVGGGVGSTAGGFKILRLLVLLRLLSLMFQRTAVPGHAVLEPRLEGRLLEAEETQRILLLILLFLIVICLSWAIFIICGYDPLNTLFEVVSATGTVGLSAGITSPELPPALKLVLCFDMLLGRLEIVALLIVLYPGTWFGRKA